MISKRSEQLSGHRRSLAMSIVLALAVAASALALSSCGGGSSGSTSAAASTSTASDSGAGLVGGANITGKKILMSIASSPSNSFYIPQVAGAKAAAAATGLKVEFQYGKDDDNVQTEQVKTAIASGIDGLAVEVPTRALNNAVCQARAKGIPVVTQGSNATTGNARACVQAFIGQDFVASGRLIAQKMVTGGFVKSGDKVFCPVELPTQAYAVQRFQGVQEVLKAIGASCELLGTGVDLGPAKAKMVDYLLGHRDTAAVIALGQTPATVAPDVVKKVGLKIPVGGFDLSKPIAENIKAGKMIATVDQQPYSQGFYAVMELALYLKYGLDPTSINTSGNALIDQKNVGTLLSLSPDYR